MEESRMFALSLSLVLTAPQTLPRLDIHGDPLPAGAVVRLGTVRYRPPADTRLLGFTHDATAVVYSAGRELIFVDVGTGKVTQHSLVKLLDLKTRGRWLRQPRMSGDGKLVAALTSDQRLLVLDTAKVQVVKEFALADFVPLPADANPPVWHDLTRDGNALVLWDYSQEDSYRLHWIDVATGAVQRETLWKKRGMIQFWCQSPQSDFVAVGMHPREDNGAFNASRYIVDVWNANSGEHVLRADVPDSCVVGALGSDGKTAILLNNRSAEVTVVDLVSGKQRGALDRSGSAHGVALSPDGKHVFVAKSDALEQWDLATVKQVRSFPQPGLPNWRPRLPISHDGRRLALEVGQMVVIHDVAAGKSFHGAASHCRTVGALAWAPSGKHLLSVDADTALWWDTAAATRQRIIERRTTPAPPDNEARHRSRRGPLAGVFADGQRLAASWWDYPVQVWEAGGKAIKLPALAKSRFGAALSPTKPVVAFGDDDGNVVLCDVALGTHSTLLPTKTASYNGHRALNLVTFSADGRYVAAGGLTENSDASAFPDPVVVWEIATARELARFTIPRAHGVQGLQFTPDGRRLAIATETAVALCDLATGREEQMFGGQRIVGATAALSRDGTLLAVGTRDGAIRLWDVKTGKLLGDVPGHWLAVRSLAFSPDGTRLASGSDDSTVLLWDVADLRRLATALPPPAELMALWERLGYPEPADARKAMAELSRHADAVKFLDERLQTVEHVDATKIAALIDDLDHEKFSVREKAKKELETMAGVAGPALLQRLKTNPSLETRQRIEALVARLDAPVTDPVLLRCLRGIEVLEWIGTPAARAVVARLAAGAPGHRLTEEARATRERMR
jgi:WD40 repeat protein